MLYDECSITLNKDEQNLRSEMLMNRLKTKVYLRPLFVESMQSTITFSYVFFSVQNDF